MLRVVIGIGANLGDRLATMRDATLRIARVPGLSIRARSRVYETAPVGGPMQPAFLNAAIAAECTLSPLSLLDELLAIEVGLGRTRATETVRWGPRTIDLDILWIEGLTLDHPRLVVPHPRLLERAFAIVPLLDVAPDAIDPRSGAAYVAPAAPGVELTALALSD